MCTCVRMYVCMYMYVFKFYPKEGVELDPLIKEISFNISYSWKFLARRLGFSDTDIDAIEYANPHELKEKI